MPDPHWISLTIDAAITLFLAVTIIQVARLNGRIARLRDDRDALGDTVKALQQSTQQAETAVVGLKAAAAEAGRGLQALIDRAEALKADLNFLTERAEKLADRVEDAGNARRRSTGDTPRSTAPKAAEEPPRSRPAEGRLAMLLRQVEDPPARVEPTLAPAPRAPEALSVPQSRAEKELKRAIEGRR